MLFFGTKINSKFYTQVFWPLVRFPKNKEIMSPNLAWEAKTSHRKICNLIHMGCNTLEGYSFKKWSFIF